MNSLKKIAGHPLRRRLMSSSASGSGARSELERTWQNHELIFRRRKTADLVRWYFLLRMSGIRMFSQNAYPLFSLANRLLGDRLFGVVFRPTVYNLFIAGHRKEEILGTMLEMQKSGLNPLLSPMLEDDLGSASESKESFHQRNLSTIRDCLSLLDDPQLDPRVVSPKTLAIKLTAFIDVDVLEKITTSMQDCDLEVEVSRGLKYLLKSDGSSEEDTLLAHQCRSQPGFTDAIKHLISIGEEAASRRILLLIDAEYSHLQPAVRLLTLCLMKEFNKAGGHVSVANTYQCYLKEAHSQVCQDLEMSSRLGFPLGAKLVRGAYLETENQWSREAGRPSPILPSYEETSRSYNSSVKAVLESVGGGGNCASTLLVATHNADSVLEAASAMAEEGMDRKRVHFAQISGMGEKLSIPLSHLGYSCLKLVPCGTVSEVLPWLARRMQENATAVERAADDRELIASELKRRGLRK